MPSALTIAAAATVIVAVVLAIARGEALIAAFLPGRDGITFDLRLAESRLTRPNHRSSPTRLFSASIRVIRG